MNSSHCIMWMVDSGADHSVVALESDFIPGTFSSEVTKHFDTANGRTRCAGFGSILLILYNMTTQKYEKLVHTNVALVENSTKRILSVSVLEDFGIYFCTETRELYGNIGTYGIQRIGGLYYVKSYFTSSDVHAVNNISAAVEIDTTDWRVLQSEFDKLMRDFGPFTFELFASDDNHFLKDYYTLKNSAFKYMWILYFFYGNPIFKNDFIVKMLTHAMESFIQEPGSTSFLFILPAWYTASWWHDFIVPYFEVVRIWPKGTRLLDRKSVV